MKRFLSFALAVVATASMAATTNLPGFRPQGGSSSGSTNNPGTTPTPGAGIQPSPLFVSVTNASAALDGTIPIKTGNSSQWKSTRELGLKPLSFGGMSPGQVIVTNITHDTLGEADSTYDYVGFPVLAFDGVRLYSVFRAAQGHEFYQSHVWFGVSEDFGTTWRHTKIFDEPGYDLRNFAFGIGMNNRLLLNIGRFNLASNHWVSSDCYYSDTLGTNWILSGTINTNVENFTTGRTTGTTNYTGGWAPYGAITERDGVIYGSWYSAHSTSNLYATYSITSTDNGITWTNGFIGGSAIGAIVEPAVLPINPKLSMAVTRKQSASAGYPYLFQGHWSTNGAANWFYRPTNDWMRVWNPGDITSSNASYSAPAHLALKETDDGPMVVMGWGERFAGKYFVSQAYVEDVWRYGPSVLSWTNVYDTGLWISDHEGTGPDGGMGAVIPLPSGDIFIAYYFVHTNVGSRAEIRYAKIPPDAFNKTTNLFLGDMKLEFANGGLKRVTPAVGTAPFIPALASNLPVTLVKSSNAEPILSLKMIGSEIGLALTNVNNIARFGYPSAAGHLWIGPENNSGASGPITIMSGGTATGFNNMFSILHSLPGSGRFRVAFGLPAETLLVQSNSVTLGGDTKLVRPTNAAPTGIVWGTTAPDYWVSETNSGVLTWAPRWVNH